MVIWLLAILAVVVLGGIAVVAAGAGGSMRRAYEDRPDVTVPAGRRLTADDVRPVRFSVGFRGYRMDEVDSLLDGVATERAERDSMPRADTEPAPDEQPR